MLFAFIMKRKLFVFDFLIHFFYFILINQVYCVVNLIFNILIITRDLFITFKLYNRFYFDQHIMYFLFIKGYFAFLIVKFRLLFFHYTPSFFYSHVILIFGYFHIFDIDFQIFNTII